MLAVLLNGNLQKGTKKRATNLNELLAKTTKEILKSNKTPVFSCPSYAVSYANSMS